MQIKMHGDKFEKTFPNYLLVAILQALLAVCRGISLKKTFPNYLLVAILQAPLAVCRGIKNDITAIKVYSHGR